MKITMPASGDKSEALFDNRFGRCPFFCFYNNETKKMGQPKFSSYKEGLEVVIQEMKNDLPYFAG